MSLDHAALGRRAFGGPLRLIVTAGVLLALDLITKYLAVGALATVARWSSFPTGSTLSTSRTAGRSSAWARATTPVHRRLAIAIGFVVYLFTRPPRRWWYDITLGMLLAGILGNLYDRVTLGHVRRHVSTPCPVFTGVALGRFRSSTTRRRLIGPSSRGCSTSPTRSCASASLSC